MNSDASNPEGIGDGEGRELPSANFPNNRSVAIQIWIIGALIPLTFILAGVMAEHDFAHFWVAADQVFSGNAAAIANPEATRAYAARMGFSVSTSFIYPPHALFFFLPFGLLPYFPAYLAWNAATAGFFYWAARPYVPRGLPAVLAVLTPAALICMDFGQTGLLFGGLWLLAFRRKWAAVALLTFKPHLGFLSILSLRSRRAFAYTVLLALGLVVVSALLFGSALWLAFVDHSISQAGKITTMKRWLFAGVTPTFAYGTWGWVAFAIVGALLLAERVNVFTAATATFLIAPYGLHYDMPVVCLGFGLLINEHWRDMPIRHRIPTVIGFLSPVIAIGGAWWMPPLIGWALWAQTKYEAGTVGTPAVPQAFTSQQG